MSQSEVDGEKDKNNNNDDNDNESVVSQNRKRCRPLVYFDENDTVDAEGGKKKKEDNSS